MGTMKSKTGTRQRSVALGGDHTGEWEVRVGSGTSDKNVLPSTVVKTTEVKIQSHSRRRSDASLAESKQEILPDTLTMETHDAERECGSSASSDVGYGKYANPTWH